MSHTPAVEDYLKSIYALGRSGEAATTSALADRLGVSPASVTGMLKKLAASGLVAHEKYQGARLTEAGRLVAVETIRHHRLVETYLHQALGVPWDRLHDEAEAWEHVLSEDLEERMDAALGHPTHDPHGAPIPSPDLVLSERDLLPLARLEPGQAATVARVSDHDADLLRAVGGAGLYPGTRFRLDAVGDDGAVVLHLLSGDRAGETVSLGAAAPPFLFLDDVGE
ncbi:metal-dependent transcriptional regulator [Rubrivirga sp. S365]|uniref:metal-dependent transcriptional regulator n=1 Tax=Rubrivirga sp. S365 TaxID=3076080 RepID=UPI0028C8BDAF|nr:metal-dependent transcriptional regulator [Rubrivirga sp. S365]MDT7856258.1 metal-dependent transcriptional regulator [Rubrivirga sp. S365]